MIRTTFSSRRLFAAALPCAPMLAAAGVACAETDVYRDVLRVERSQAQTQKSGRDGPGPRRVASR